MWACRSATVDGMSKASGNDTIDAISPGDIVTVNRGTGERPYKVVFKDTSDAGYLVTSKATRAKPSNSTWPPAPR